MKVSSFPPLFLSLALLCQWLLFEKAVAFTISFASSTAERQVLQMMKFPNIFESLPLFSSSQVRAKDTQKREMLKSALLEACMPPFKNRVEQRERIEAIINELREQCPTSPATAASPLLQKKWALTWTTEKEINFFLDVGFSDEIGQTIAGSSLDNNIEFLRGGGLYVSGSLSIPDPEGPRTDFEFETAKLDLGKWGTFTFPPVGAGWFDTVYLDDTLRVDLNSRNDILICTPY
jgi:PAP_fibrillin